MKLLPRIFSRLSSTFIAIFFLLQGLSAHAQTTSQLKAQSLEGRSDILQKVFVELVEAADQNAVKLLQSLPQAKIDSDPRGTNLKNTKSILSLKSGTRISFSSPTAIIGLLKATQSLQRFGLINSKSQLIKSSQVYSTAVPLSVAGDGRELYLAVSVFGGFNDGSRRLISYVTPLFNSGKLAELKINSVSLAEEAELPTLSSTRKEVRVSEKLGRIFIREVLKNSNVRQLTKAVQSELGYELFFKITPQRYEQVKKAILASQDLVTDEKNLGLTEAVKINKNNSEGRWLVINGFEKSIDKNQKRSALLLLGFSFSKVASQKGEQIIGNLNNFNFKEHASVKRN